MSASCFQHEYHCQADADSCESMEAEVESLRQRLQRAETVLQIVADEQSRESECFFCRPAMWERKNLINGHVPDCPTPMIRDFLAGVASQETK